MRAMKVPHACVITFLAGAAREAAAEPTERLRRLGSPKGSQSSTGKSGNGKTKGGEAGKVSTS